MKCELFIFAFIFLFNFLEIGFNNEISFKMANQKAFAQQNVVDCDSERSMARIIVMRGNIEIIQKQGRWENKFPFSAGSDIW